MAAQGGNKADIVDHRRRRDGKQRMSMARQAADDYSVLLRLRSYGDATLHESRLSSWLGDQA